MRQLYIKGVIGVGKLRTRYGSRKDRGVRPARFKKSSGKILRVILQQAEKAGLVEKVLPSAQLDLSVENLARRIADNAPIAAQLAKHLVRVSQSTAVDIGLQYENDTFAYCFTTQDSTEGRKAFVEKRKPVFRGQ